MELKLSSKHLEQTILSYSHFIVAKSSHGNTIPLGILLGAIMVYVGISEGVRGGR